VPIIPPILNPPQIIDRLIPWREHAYVSNALSSDLHPYAQRLRFLFVSVALALMLCLLVLLYHANAPSFATTLNFAHFPSYSPPSPPQHNSLKRGHFLIPTFVELAEALEQKLLPYVNGAGRR
jgi:hypothetical protein